MKPLNDLEPRVPIYAGDLPLAINQAGSYYLMQDVSTTGGGITINASNVTIDLMGFTLTGGTGNGINAPYSFDFTTIRNGTVQGWSGHGIALHNNAVVVDVVSRDNLGNGIQVWAYGRVIDSAVESNVGHGLTVLANSIIRGVRSWGNAENGIWADESMVTDCEVSSNGKNGIRVDSRCYVRGCLVMNNYGPSNDKAGIWVLGNTNRIEGNHLHWNGVGMDIDGIDNMIFKNTVYRSRSGVHFDVAATATGNLLEINTSLSTAGPWSNFTD